VTSSTLEAPGVTPTAAPVSGRIASFPSMLKANPYQRLLYGQLAAHGLELEQGAEFRLRWLLRRRGQVELLHFHWPHGYWRASSRRGLGGPLADWLYLGVFAARLAAARLLGYRVAWTIHQVFSHEHTVSRLDRTGARLLARSADVLLAHDQATADHARSELGLSARRVAVVPHGSYIGVYRSTRTRDEARRDLGFDADQLVFLHFGDVRGYKDVDRLLRAFRAARLPEAALVVAGSDRGPSGDAARAAARADARIVPLLGFVEDDRVAALYAAADVAVVARSDGGTSGSLILALSMGKPVVAADRRAYRELLDGDAAGWLFEPGDERSLAGALERAAAATDAERASKGQMALAHAEALDWIEIGRATADLLLRGRTAAA
jgi:glycosyltransferase involved in cell wall biosynthesis